MSREGRASRPRAARLAIAVVSVAASVAFGASWTSGQDPSTPPGMGDGMGGSTASPPMGGMGAPPVPPVHGLYAGTGILFIHTEAPIPGWPTC